MYSYYASLSPSLSCTVRIEFFFIFKECPNLREEDPYVLEWHRDENNYVNGYLVKWEVCGAEQLGLLEYLWVRI